MVRSMPAVGHHPPLALALLGAIAAMLCLSACGSHVVIVNSTEVRLRLDEFSITPQTIQVHAGRIKIVAINVGVETHDVVVEDNFLNAAGNPIIRGPQPIQVLQPGQTSTYKVTLQPGRYKLIDTVANHADLGAYGTLIVLK
jgi:uncharacterized cupredoxin-like copper-binding protein